MQLRVEEFKLGFSLNQVGCVIDKYEPAIMGTEGMKEIVRVASALFTGDELTQVQLLRGEDTKLMLFH